MTGSINQIFMSATSAERLAQAVLMLVGILLASTIAACTNTPSAPTPSTQAQSVELRADGVGAIAMSVNDASTAIASPLPPLQGEPLPKNLANQSCYYAKPQTPTLKGAELMLNQGKVVRADIVDEGGIKTAAGLGVGASQAEVEKAYAGTIQVMPDKYLQNGKNLVVTPANQPNYRIIFETENDRVTAIRIGRTPEVELVERCG